MYDLRKIAIRIYVESQYRRLSERSFEALKVLVPYTHPEVNAYSIDPYRLANAVSAHPDEILHSQLSLRISRRYEPKENVGYKVMALVADATGFALRPAFTLWTDIVRSNDIHAMCENSRSQMLTHAQARLRAYETGDDASDACGCGIYSCVSARALGDTYDDRRLAVAIIRPFGIVEVSDDTMRSTDALIESVHVSADTCIDGLTMYPLAGVGSANAFVRGLTHFVRDEICQAIADDLGVDVVYHQVPVRYHLGCHMRDDVTVYKPRAEIVEALRILRGD